MTFNHALKSGKTSAQEALAIFDSLDPISADFMLGDWQGAGFPTDHPMDGVLETFHWYGKRFDGPEDVHPLVFSTPAGGKKTINPVLVMPGLGLLDYLPFLNTPLFGRVFQIILPLFATRRSRARLRLTEYRGKSSATMIYDNLAINDVFRKVDDNTVMGVMDFKRMTQPFFFVLKREKKR
jgi:hypothetical protein